MRRQHIRFVPGQRILFSFFVIGIANFVVFVLVAAAIGGDAINGYEEHGRYFLRAHGRTTEVSRSVFTYSKWHAISAIIIHPLMILVGALHWLWGLGQNSN